MRCCRRRRRWGMHRSAGLGRRGGALLMLLAARRERRRGGGRPRVVVMVVRRGVLVLDGRLLLDGDSSHDAARRRRRVDGETLSFASGRKAISRRVFFAFVSRSRAPSWAKSGSSREGMPMEGNYSSGDGKAREGRRSGELKASNGGRLTLSLGGDAIFGRMRARSWPSRGAR